MGESAVTTQELQAAFKFDDRNVHWLPYPGLDSMLVSILFVDEASNSADFLARFTPNSKTVIHRHIAMTHILVIEGDHVIYEPDGSVRESRPVGTYTAGYGGEAHDEGGGPNGAVLLYSVRGESDALFEIHQPAGTVAAVIHTADLKAMQGLMPQAV